MFSLTVVSLTTLWKPSEWTPTARQSIPTPHESPAVEAGNFSFGGDASTQSQKKFEPQPGSTSEGPWPACGPVNQRDLHENSFSKSAAFGYSRVPAWSIQVKGRVSKFSEKREVLQPKKKKIFFEVMHCVLMKGPKKA